LNVIFTYLNSYDAQFTIKSGAAMVADNATKV